MLSDAAAEEIVEDLGSDPKGPFGSSVWHVAASQGYTEVLRWLKFKGTCDMINDRNNDGSTPLMLAIEAGHEDTARWMVANGADPTVEDNGYASPFAPVRGTIFCQACRHSSFSLVQDLAEKIPPEQLTHPVFHRITPMGEAFRSNADRILIVQMLVLRFGYPVRPSDFSGANTEPLRALLDWAEAELATRHTMITLVLGCGVHARRQEGGGAVGAIIGQLRAAMATGSQVGVTGRDLDVVRRMLRAAGDENHLYKLRGAGNTDVRMRIARCLGVPKGAEVKRLRAAAAVWRGLV